MVACVVEGKTEFYTLPKFVGRLGHCPVLTLKFDGGNGDQCPWDALIISRVVPRVIGAAQKNPDKVLVVLDREGRVDCPPDLASKALEIITTELASRNIHTPVSVVVCDRRFENLLMADTNLVDRFRFLKSRFSEKVGNSVDGKNVVGAFNECCLKGEKYDKVAHGIALAQRMDLQNQQVLARSRSLRKLVKELTT